MDCNGECGGTALVGDLDNNDAQEYADAVAYVEGILGNDLEPLSCTDIDQDGNITVSDAALMSQCQWFNEAHTHPDSSGVHDKCAFPVQEITNIFDTVHFMVADVNWGMNYFDVHVMNPLQPHRGVRTRFHGSEHQRRGELGRPHQLRHLSVVCPRGQQDHRVELRRRVVPQKPGLGALLAGVLGGCGQRSVPGGSGGRGQRRLREHPPHDGGRMPPTSSPWKPRRR